MQLAFQNIEVPKINLFFQDEIMFKKYAAALFTVTALYAASALPACATTINFTTVATGTAVTNQYAGVTFSLAGSHDASGPATVGYGGLTNTSYSGAYPTAQYLVANFASAITDLSFVFNNAGYNGANAYSLYDAAGGVIATGAMSGSGDITYNLTSLTGITKIVWDNGTAGSSSNWWQKLDTISYVADPSAIPEPATLALFAIGVIGFAVARRKQAA